MNEKCCLNFKIFVSFSFGCNLALVSLSDHIRLIKELSGKWLLARQMMDTLFEKQTRTETVQKVNVPVCYLCFVDG